MDGEKKEYHFSSSEFDCLRLKSVRVLNNIILVIIRVKYYYIFRNNQHL